MVMIKKEQLKNKGLNIVDREANHSDEQAQRFEQLKKINPAFIDGDGQINFEAIRSFYGVSDSYSEKQNYQLSFAGKSIANALAQTLTDQELKVEHKQSKNFNDTDNIIIRGDNLDALKILNQNYADKIKMIYIDPPYNTQSEEFIYQDNFSQNIAQLEEEYEIDKESLRYLADIYGMKKHSGWLGFMYPRLKLAKDLLSEDGVIFISIDDHEHANLKLLCDEIFGEDNFICNFVWHKRSEGGQVKDGAVINQVENILLYSKNKTQGAINKLANGDVGKVKWRDFRKSGGGWQKYHRPNQHFPFYYLEKDDKLSLDNVEGAIVVLPQNKEGVDGYWENYPPTALKRLKDGELRCCKKNGRYKIEQMDVTGADKSVGNFIKIASKQGSENLIDIFGSLIFNNPKPVSLIELLTEIGSNKDSIILDFFAGSGTTAQAIMKINQEDGGNRKFIMVQSDEAIDSKRSKESFNFCESNKLAPVISSICIERANRAGKKLQNGKGEITNHLDIGYKVFSLIEKPVIAAGNELTLVSNRSTTYDTLYNMMAIVGTNLSESIEEVEKDKLYKISNDYFVVGECQTDLSSIKQRIHIDGYADINLEKWLNLVGLKHQNTAINIVY